MVITDSLFESPYLGPSEFHFWCSHHLSVVVPIPILVSSKKEKHASSLTRKFILVLQLSESITSFHNTFIVFIRKLLFGLKTGAGQKKVRGRSVPVE
jgi:hypothetical protein